MGKPSPPTAPDPYTTAQAQYSFGTEAADYSTALNDINTQGPTGSSSYAITGYDPTTGAPIRTQTTSLSAPEQGILNSSQGVQQGQLDTAGNLLNEFNTESAQGEPNIKPVQYNVGATGPTTTSIAAAPGIVNTQDAYNTGQSTALAGELAAINPSLDQQRAALDSSLRNSGAHPGDPAYDNAMSQLDASQTQSRLQAAGQAIGEGNTLQNTQYGESANTNSQIFGENQAESTLENQEQSTLFGEGATNANLNNSAGTTDLADWSNKLGIPLNELSAILGGSQVSSPSSISPTGASVSAPDVMSAFQNQYAGQMAGYNAAVGTQNSEYGDLASLGMLAYLAAA